MNTRFLRWYTAKWQKQIREVALPMVARIEKSGELEPRALIKLNALFGKIVDNAATHYRKPLRKSGTQYSGDSLSRIVTNPSPDRQIAEYFHYRVYTILSNPKEVIEEVSKLRRIAKDPHQIEALEITLEIALDMVPVRETLDRLRALKEETKDAYRAPRASSETMKQIHGLLVEITKEVHDALMAQWRKMLLDYVVAFETNKKPDQSIYDFHKTPYGPTFGYVFVRTLIDETNEYGAKRTYTQKRVKDFKKTLEALALREVQQIEMAFISKNIAKLSPIVDQRKDFQNARLLGTSIRAGNLEGDIQVDFKGGRFRVHNQVVWSTSINGKHFIRYPTTFHDVELGGGGGLTPGGSCRVMGYKFKPEEWMNEVFAVSK